MKPLLAIAEILCGRSRRLDVIEPLVADWDRELRDAASQPLLVRASVFRRGALALSLTLVLCSFRHAFSPEGGMWKYGVGAFVLALALSLAAEAALIDFSLDTDYTADMFLLAAIRLGGAAALAPAMLPALLLLRRGSQARFSKAAAAIGLGSGLAVAGAIAQPWLADLQPTAGQNERMYQRMLANDRAGKFQYPGTARRELRERDSTPETRRAGYEQFRVWRAEQVAKEPPGPTTWQRVQRSTLPLLAALFGTVGWTLGALVRPTFSRALVWWGVAWLVTLAADGRLSNALGLPGFWLSWWTLPSILAAVALALALASTKHRSTSTPAPTP